MKKTALVYMLLILLLVAAPVMAVTEQEYREVWKCFMAPDWCGMTLDSCPAYSAEQMRQEIVTFLEQGKTTQEIIDHYVGKYGERILAAPQQKGFGIIAWVMPVVLLLLGLLVFGAFMQRGIVPIPAGNGPKGSGSKSRDISSEYDQLLEKEIKKRL